MNKQTIYVTHGKKYHTDKQCPQMRNGEEMHRYDDDSVYDGGFTAGTYRNEVPSPEVAASRGKLPCLYCVEPEDRTFPPLYGQNFGHRPVNLYEDTRFDIVSLACARCITWTNWPEVDMKAGVRVKWPCTSAVVLGLVKRPKELTA